MPHALLFAGPEGIGKRSFARRLAQALLCPAANAELEPCETCPSCRQVRAGTHPDLREVGRPEDRHELPIAVIRALCHDLALKPISGHRKVAILDDADAMNAEAANAFLKTLEEPPEGTTLILISTASGRLLETIRSRCRIVRFEPLGVEDLVAVLRDRAGIETAEAHTLAARASGSVARALALADPDLTGFLQRLIGELAAPEAIDAPGLARRFEAFLKEAGTESLAQRSRATVVFGELAGFFRGVLWQVSGLEPPAPDEATRAAVRRLAERVEPDTVFLLAERCLDAEFQLQRRVQTGLILEAWAHDVANLIETGVASR